MHEPWKGPVLPLRRIPNLETDSPSTCASDTFPAPTSLVAEIRSGRRLAYPVGKDSQSRRTCNEKRPSTLESGLPHTCRGQMMGRRPPRPDLRPIAELPERPRPAMGPAISFLCGHFRTISEYATTPAQLSFRGVEGSPPCSAQSWTICQRGHYPVDNPIVEESTGLVLLGSRPRGRWSCPRAPALINP